MSSLCKQHVLVALPSLLEKALIIEVAWCRFASIAKMAGDEMEPYVAQLVPKLYRYATNLIESYTFAGP